MTRARIPACSSSSKEGWAQRRAPMPDLSTEQSPWNTAQP